MCATLKKLRVERGLTLQEMANLLGLKTASAYCKKETGSVPVSLDEAKVISDFFHKPMEEIFFPKDFPNKKD